MPNTKENRNLHINKTEYTNIFSKDNILSHLKNEVNVIYFDTIDSTNSEAKRHSETISSTPTLFVANHQSNGRGRLGRKFYSPGDTGLYMSLMLKSGGDFFNTVSMTTATAVCVANALEDLCDIKPQIKWVNDIYVNNKKICGILCEAITDEKTFLIKGIVIGIGINISTTDFPLEIKDTAASIGQAIDRSRLCARITDNIINSFKNIADRSYIDEYKKRSLVLNREITYTENGVTKSAKAVDIDSNGGLIVETENGRKTLSTGEITVRLKKQ